MMKQFVLSDDVNLAIAASHIPSFALVKMGLKLVPDENRVTPFIRTFDLNHKAF